MGHFQILVGDKNWSKDIALPNPRPSWSSGYVVSSFRMLFKYSVCVE